ncbi:MAG: hypothetical protein C5B50_10430 [Verrucomicrobia bacterium]|nr:MAG: hypothetical protein C5B50_10430 [Verrucomicrobiota bacterium]
MRFVKTHLLLALLVLCVAGTRARAVSYSVDWFTIDDGGGTSTGGVYAVSDTIGQPDADGPMTGGRFSVTGGFWSLFSSFQAAAPPRLTISRTATNSIIVSWPYPSTGFSLVQNTALNTTNWVTPPQTVTNNGIINYIIVTPIVGNRFYRLQQPLDVLLTLNWTNRYDGPLSTNDFAWAIAVDGSGNVFVTGQSYERAGVSSFATVKYSNAGLLLWSNRYSGSGAGQDAAYGIAVDTNGNVFVTGTSYSSGGGADFATIKYSSAGVPLWTNRYNGPGNGFDGANAVAVDSNGNVFVTGESAGSGSGPDFATIKYSNAGVPLWTNRYNGPGNGYDSAYAIALDSGGNVFVTGASTGSGGDYDYATIKYSNAGAPLWTNRYNGPGNGYDSANAIAVDSAGNVFVTGSSPGSASGGDYATIKYSNAGVALWTNRYNGPGNGEDSASAIAVDSAGNVFVTGQSAGSGSSYDYATIKYSNAGLPLWTNRYNGLGNDDDSATAMAVDSSGNVFVTGYSVGSASGNDYATIKYSNAGVPLWTNLYNGPGNSDDSPFAMALDRAGNVFVTGSSVGSGGDYDYATIKYAADFVPSLGATLQGTNLVLKWPTNAAGFNLWWTTALGSTWTSNSTLPTISGTNFTVPDLISGPKKFYRLQK